MNRKIEIKRERLKKLLNESHNCKRLQNFLGDGLKINTNFLSDIDVCYYHQIIIDYPLYEYIFYLNKTDRKNKKKQLLRTAIKEITARAQTKLKECKANKPSASKEEAA